MAQAKSAWGVDVSCPFVTSVFLKETENNAWRMTSRAGLEGGEGTAGEEVVGRGWVYLLEPQGPWVKGLPPTAYLSP